MQQQRCCRNYKDVDQGKQNQGLKRGWDREMMGGVKKVNNNNNKKNPCILYSSIMLAI